jgi:6-phosphogluconolactonase (cycloisomerase 2 family)
LLWLAIALGASGCPTKQAVPRYPRFAYVVDQSEQAVSVYQVLATSRRLRPLGYVWFPQFLEGLRAFGDGDWLLVGGGGNVALYQIDDSTGFLSPTPMTTVTDCPGRPLLTDDGAYLFCMSSHGDVGAFLFDAGSTTFKARGSAPTPGSKLLALDPQQRFVLAGNESASQITPVKLSLPRPLSAASAGPPWSIVQPWSAVIERTGRWAYVASGVTGTQTSLQVVALRSDGTAAGPPLQSLLLAGWRLDLKLNAAGSELFVIGHGPLRSFLIDPATGMLSPSGRLMPAVAAGDIAFDIAGRFAYVPGVPDGPLTMIDLADPTQTGLSASVVDQLNSAWGMRWMEISTGTFVAAPHSALLLVTDFASSSLSSFAIDQKSGALTHVADAPTGGAGATWLAVSPNSRFAFVVSSFSGEITPFAVDPNSGMITAVTPKMSLPGPVTSIVVDRSGRFLMALISSPAEIAIFPIDPATGALGAVVDQFALAFSNPSSITVSHQGDVVLAVDAGRAGEVGGKPGEVDILTLHPFGIPLQSGTFNMANSAFPLSATGSFALGAIFDPFDHAVAEWGDRSVVTLNSGGTLNLASEEMLTSQPITSVSAAADGASLFAICADNLNFASKVAHFGLDPASGGFLNKQYEIQFDANVQNPVASRADASGRWFYLLDRDAQKIFLYDRDVASGTLQTQVTTGVAGTTRQTRLVPRTSFPAGATPFDMQIVDVMN